MMRYQFHNLFCEVFLSTHLNTIQAQDQKPFLLIGNILDTTEVHAEMLQELTTPEETVQQFRKEITDTEEILTNLQMQSKKRSASWLADESPQKKWRQSDDFAMEL